MADCLWGEGLGNDWEVNKNMFWESVKHANKSEQSMDEIVKDVYANIAGI